MRLLWVWSVTRDAGPGWGGCDDPSGVRVERGGSGQSARITRSQKLGAVFRARLIAGRLEQGLLDAVLAQLRERGLLKARGRQRTDSTHVLAAVRTVNRLESVGETLRAALNALATVAPDWLAQHADTEWPDRYGRPFEEWRLPKGEGPRKVLGEQIGRDGHRLLAAAYDPSAPSWLCALPAGQTLRQAWVNQFYVEDDRVTWRDRAELSLPRIGGHLW